MFEAFQKGEKVKRLGNAQMGIKTANNEKYMRMLWEVKNTDINKKWFICAKGGNFRKYFGNLDRVIDWSENAKNFYHKNKSSSLVNEKYLFLEGITYTTVTSSGTGFRILPNYCLFSNGGPTILNIKNIYYIIGFLNSNIVQYLLQFLNPTINLMLYNVNEIPIIFDESFDKEIGIYLLISF